MTEINLEFFNITFIVAISILIGLSCRGYKRGILYVIFGVISIIFMVLFTSFTEPIVTQFIRDNTPVEENLHDLIVEDLNKRSEELAVNNGGSGVNVFINSLPVSLGTKINETKDHAKNVVIESTADALCYRAMTGISSILTMIAGIVIVLTVRAIVLAIGHVPLIRGVNKFLGFITGFAEGIMVIWVILFFASRFVSSTLGHAIIEDCSNNFILTILYETNPIVWYLG